MTIRKLTPEQIDELEKLVDFSSAKEVLEALAAICSEKAEHLRTNWQDNGAAKEWDKACRRIESATVAVGKLYLS